MRHLILVCLLLGSTMGSVTAHTEITAAMNELPPSSYEAVLLFANVSGVAPDRLEQDYSKEEKTLKLLEAFGYEGKPENFPGLIKNRPDLVKAMENWVDSLRGGPRSAQQLEDQSTNNGNNNNNIGDNWFKISQSPEQIHIALTRFINPAAIDDDDAVDGSSATHRHHHNNISVLWATNSTTGNTCVCWWPEEGTINNNKTCTRGGNETSWTFNPSSVIPWKGWIHGGFIASNEITPNARYCYQVGGCTPETTSTEEHCFTAPNTASPIDQHQQQASAPQQEEYLFALGGDMGSYQLVGHLMAKQMRSDEISESLRFDAFWHLGDISYSTVSPPHWNFEFFWDVYMRQEQSFADHVPMLVTYGNHDVGGGDSASYLNRFFNPHNYYGVTNTTAAGAAPPGSFGNHNPFYWSYEHGPIKYVSMCTEPEMNPVRCDYSPGSTQYQWLEEELSSVNRTRTPWLVLAGHRPMYSSDRGTDSGPLRKFIEPLLVKYKVDVELAGHMHETEVIAPVVDKKVNLTGVTFNGTISGSGEPPGVNNSFIFNQPSQPVHLTMGTLGAVIDEHWVEPRPEWSLFHKGTLFDDAYGYVQLRASMRKLHFQFKRQMNNSTLWELEIRK